MNSKKSSPDKVRAKAKAERRQKAARTKKIKEEFQITVEGTRITAKHKDGFSLLLDMSERPVQAKSPDGQDSADRDALRKHLDGYAVNRDVQYRVHIYETPTKRYKTEGTLLMTDPSTGQILQASGNRRRKILAKNTTTAEERTAIQDGKRSEKLNIKKMLYLNSIDDIEDVVERIYKKTLELYLENQSALESRLAKGDGSGAILHPFTLFEYYQKRFFSTQQSVKAKTQERRQGELRRICVELNEYTAGSIPDLAIRRLREQLGSRPDDKLRVAEKFFQYCLEKGYIRGENPFTRFFQHHVVCSDSSVMRAKLGRIDLDTEQKLHKLIERELGHNSKALAILLAKDAHLDVREICDLRWKDMDIQNDRVIVINHHPDCSGSLHNFSRPILPYAAHVIRTVYRQLISEHGEDEVKKMYVVSSTEDPLSPLETKTVTSYIRNTLYRAGVSRDLMQIASTQGKKTSGGAGVRLLHAHYKYILETECGVQNDSGRFKFLCGEVPTDILTQYYRNLTDHHGSSHLHTLVRRDGRFYTAPEPLEESEAYQYFEIATERMPEETERLVGPAAGNLLSGAIGTAYLPIGTEIFFYAHHGLDVNSLTVSPRDEAGEMEQLELKLPE